VLHALDAAPHAAADAPHAPLAAQVFMRLSHDEAGVLQRPVGAD
jgi:hypothetical protein